MTLTKNVKRPAYTIFSYLKRFLKLVTNSLYLIVGNKQRQAIIYGYKTSLFQKLWQWYHLVVFYFVELL